MRCPKCSGALLRKNEDGDYECFCGYIIYQKTPTTNPTAAHTQPTHKRSTKGCKRGHYSKTADKVPSVTNLYSQGNGLRSVATELNLAKNTVRSIIAEHPSLGQSKRKWRPTETNTNNIIKALKGLACSMKAYNLPLEGIPNRTSIILEKYLKDSPVKTVSFLMGNNEFTPDDLIKKALEVVLTQYLHLDTDFEEIGNGMFRLRTKK